MNKSEFSYYNIFKDKTKGFDKEKCIKFCGLILFINICINAYNEGLIELEKENQENQENQENESFSDSDSEYSLIEPVD